MPSGIKQTQEQQDRIALLVSQGVSRKYVAERFGINPVTVSRIVNKRRRRNA